MGIELARRLGVTMAAREKGRKGDPRLSLREGPGAPAAMYHHLDCQRGRKMQR